uniref:Uncharacterized protein n=2 Tax=Anguilla anguilla TaxID=7936 RepID=A0A0E9QBV8_ANGAN
MQNMKLTPETYSTTNKCEPLLHSREKKIRAAVFSLRL